MTVLHHHPPRRKRGQRVPPDPDLRVRCLVMSRVVGYLSPVNNWHLGKKQEFKDRVTYDITDV